MKHTGIIILIVMIASSAFAQRPANYDKNIDHMYKHTVELIHPEELHQNLEANPNIVVLDARENNEYKVSHIKGSRLVGYNKFSLESVKDIPKDTPLVVYCSLGVRSEQIGEKLIAAGYSNVKNLYGGIFDWVYHDYLIVDKKEHRTDKVHTYDKNWSQWLLKGRKVY